MLHRNIYEYAVKKDLWDDDRYVKKPIKAHIMLNKKGEFLGVETIKGYSCVCPNFDDSVLIGDGANFIVEKAKCILLPEIKGNDKHKRKHDSYYVDICGAAESNENILPIKIFIDKEVHNAKKLRPELKALIDASEDDRISFNIDGINVEEKPSYWKEYFEARNNHYIKTNTKDYGNITRISVITGKEIKPVVKTGKTRLGRGDYITSAGEPAYNFYGFSKGLVAPMSKEESHRIQSGFNHIFENTYIEDWNKAYFYEDNDIAFDQFDITLNGQSLADFAEDENDMYENSRNHQTDKFYNYFKDVYSLKHLENNNEIIDIPVHSFSFKSGGGRMILSNYKVSTFNTIIENQKKFYDDTLLEVDYFRKEKEQQKKKSTKSKKEDFDNKIKQVSKAPIIHLMSVLEVLSSPYHRKSYKPKDIRERVQKEFSTSVKDSLLSSVFEGTQIPDILYYKALNKTRIYFKRGDTPPVTLFKLIKCYLNRLPDRKDEKIMATLNPDKKSIGYNLGRLMATYELYQKRAYPDVKSPIRTRFYVSLREFPANTLSSVSAKAVNYEKKLITEGKSGTAVYFERILEDIFKNIETVPEELDAIEQGEFDLGYYQQKRFLFTKKNDNNDVDFNDEINEEISE